MGVKTGLLVTAIGLAIALHAHKKNKKQQQQSSSSWGKPAAALAGLGATGYAAHHYLGNSSQQPQQALPPPSYDARPTLRDPAAIYHHLVEACVQKKLDRFYPPNQPAALRQIAEAIAQSGALERLANEWQLPDPFALDLVRLALFDIILLVDDSSSMRGGNNLAEMRQICADVAYAASFFDPNGIEVRFFNSKDAGNNIRDANAVNALLQRNPPNGRTPMGESLRDKILMPMTIRPAQQGSLRKPQLVMIFTDGAATDSYRDTPPKVIAEARQQLQRTQYGENCVFFSFAQVGDDAGAIQYLSDLDEDKTIGNLVDVTSSTRHEMKQVLDSLKRDPKGVPSEWANLKSEMRPDSPIWTTLFRVKRLVGAIHPWYDQSDEDGGKKKRFSFGSSRDFEYKPHWSEDPNYIQHATARLQSRGYEAYPTGPAAAPPMQAPQQPSFQPQQNNSWPAAPSPQPAFFNGLASYDQYQGAPPQGAANVYYNGGAPPQQQSYQPAYNQASPFPPSGAPYQQPNSPYPPAQSSYPPAPAYGQSGGFIGGFGGGY